MSNATITAEKGFIILNFLERISQVLIKKTPLLKKQKIIFQVVPLQSSQTPDLQNILQLANYSQEPIAKTFITKLSR